MKSVYGKFVYESITDEDFAVFVTVPCGTGRLLVASFAGKNAAERGMKFYRICIGVDV
jgi:hypothetical protein